VLTNKEKRGTTMRKLKRLSLVIIIMFSTLFAGNIKLTPRLKQIAKAIEAQYPNMTRAENGPISQTQKMVLMK